jgi:hypothetical protein
VQAHTGYLSFWHWLLVIGVGSGLTMSPMRTAIMGTVPPARVGMASATSNTMRQVGSVFGIAVLGNLVTRRFIDEMSSALRSLRLPASVQDALVRAAKEDRMRLPAHVPPRHRRGRAPAHRRSRLPERLHLGYAPGPVGERRHAPGRAPIALAAICGTVPHHVAARQAAQLAAEPVEVR